MTHSKIKWTDQQRRAITGRGSDIIVTASAGTGKTAVLSGRCVDIIAGGEGGVSSMLVMTFTEAAAEQMRQRISQQLRQAYAHTGNNHLLGQLIQLQGAQISTIHSFCKRLITEHFYTLGLDPTFRIIEEDEQGLIKSEVLEQTVEWAWQQQNLQEPLRQLLQGRDGRCDDGFCREIIRANEFLTTIIDRDQWCRDAVAIAECINPLDSDPARAQKQLMAEQLAEIIEQVEHCRDVCRQSGQSGNWAQSWHEYLAQPAKQALEYLQTEQWSKAFELIRNFELGRRQYKPRAMEDQACADMLGQAVKAARGQFENLKSLALVNPDYLQMLAPSLRMQTRVFVELLCHFQKLYARRKAKLNCLDFADLEHYALKLLTEKDPAGKLVPSEAARALGKRYKHIFIDEYQDINPVQQAILASLSTPGSVFRVGDIKQSIYAFRGAAPGIFLKDITAATEDIEKASGQGLRIDLQTNWRSRKEILEFVNFVFGRVMRAGFADIDYDDSARLLFPEQSHSDTEPRIELHLLDEDAGDDENDDNDQPCDQPPVGVITARQRQAALVARRILEMVNNEKFSVTDQATGTARAVEFRDIVILLRSPAAVVNDYVEMLRQANVPVSGQACAGYFQKTEVADCMSLLKILDNPRQEIELASVMRSPLFWFTDNELAGIQLWRKRHGRGDFYDGLRLFSEKATDRELADKLGRMLEKLQSWRQIARRGRLAQLIWHILHKTGYLAHVCALPNGQGRKANLLKLHERAIQFEGFVSSRGLASLRRFVEYVDRLSALGRDWSPAEPENTLENAVRILSVHKSKGLEFPVVILSQLDSKFNMRDMQGPCLLDELHTIALDIADADRGVRLRSLAHQVVAQRKKRQSMAEELRVLYVAMTRAKERLILTGTCKADSAASIASEGLYFGDQPIAHWRLKRCNRLLDWVLLGLSNCQNLHKALGTSAGSAENDDLCRIKLHSGNDITALNDYISRLGRPNTDSDDDNSPRPQTDGTQLLEKVNAALNVEYPFTGSTRLPAKQAVTGAGHSHDDLTMLNNSRTLSRRPKILAGRGTDDSAGPDARVIGTAVHLLISKLPLSNDLGTEHIENTKETLIQAGLISPDIAEHIDTGQIADFFRSQLGRRILGSEKVYRELPFTLAVQADHWQRILSETDQAQPPVKAGIGDGDFVIVQGIIDLLAIDESSAVIVDFKNDNVSADQAEQRARLYQTQLDLYSRAVNNIYRPEKIEKYLYFIRPGVDIGI